MLAKTFSRITRKLRIIWTPNRRGRKPTSEEIRSLIIELKISNPSWGGGKIRDELKKIGITICKETILNILREEGLIIPPPHGGLSWDEFLNNHKFRIGIDFTCLMDLFGRQLFIFVILNWDTRELIHINVTLNPTFEWVNQQMKNAFFEFDECPSSCISDGDPVFGNRFKNMMKSFYGTKVTQIPYKQPWKNGRTERFHLSLKKEAFTNIIALTLDQTQDICLKFKEYYNHYRCHQSLDGNVPSQRINKTQISFNQFCRKKHLDGKITTFEPIQLQAA